MFLFQTSFELMTGLPQWLGYLNVFILGSIIGSFLNVVIHRVPREQSIAFPNSACPKCGNAIRPYDNIPILSWIILRGKCRNCKEPISVRYPAVEMLTGAMFAVVFSVFGLTYFLPVALIFCAAVLALVFIDAEHMLLPDKITFPLLGFALLVRLVFPFVPGYENGFPDMLHLPLSEFEGLPAWLVSLIGAILGAVAGGGSLWLVGAVWKKLRGVDAMGLGDVKMMLGVGSLLGWRLTFVTIFVAAFTGAVAGIIVIALSKDKDMQAQIPFGIFLGIGAIAALFFGDQITRWYVETFMPA